MNEMSFRECSVGLCTRGGEMTVKAACADVPRGANWMLLLHGGLRRDEGETCMGKEGRRRTEKMNLRTTTAMK